MSGEQSRLLRNSAFVDDEWDERRNDLNLGAHLFAATDVIIDISVLLHDPMALQSFCSDNRKVWVPITRS